MILCTKNSAKGGGRTAWLAVLLFATFAAAEPPKAPESAAGAHYASLFGKAYETKADLYLFKFTDDEERTYIGARDGRTSFWPQKFPNEVKADQIGKTYGDVVIVDFVPAGSKLTIQAETHEVTSFSHVRDHGGIPMGFICSLTFDRREAKGIFAEFIQAPVKAAVGTLNQDLDSRIIKKLNP